MLHSPIEIFSSIWILSGLTSWMTAQLLKLVRAFKKTGEIDFTYFVSTGGMPSAHTATMAGMMASIGMTEGFNTAVFAVMFALTGVTMFDASTVRMAAGKQAKLLNVIVRAIREEHHLPTQPLKELLGHTRIEVFVGALVGMLVGGVTTWLWAGAR
jgi:acid phosphatase family membrane protein YuiD